MSRTPDLAEVMQLAIDGAIGGLHFSLPGTVEKYDAATQTCDVKPAVKRSLYDTDGTRTYEDLPTIPSVPIVYPRGSGFAISFPLAVGDSVVLVFSDVSLAEWRATGQVSEPKDARKHSCGHAFAMPGGFPDTKPLEDAPDGLTLGADGADGQINIKPDMIKIGKGASEFVALANLVQQGLDDIKLAFNTHMHPTAALGPPSVPASPIAVLGPVAASLTKAK